MEGVILIFYEGTFSQVWFMKSYIIQMMKWDKVMMLVIAQSGNKK